MSDLDLQFDKASKDIVTVAEEPDNITKLRLYALYKQGTEGDVKGDKPGFFDFVGNAKYEAWEKLKGTDKEQAKRDYIALVGKLTA